MSTKKPLRIAVTGAAGNIGYSLLFPIANGDMLGADQPVILQLLEITPALGALKGVEMELRDCAYPLVEDIICTDDPMVGFKDADVVMLVGSKPRGPGMERADLIRENGPIFVGQGKAIDAVAADNAKIVVIGNPCNTNCLIAMHQATRIPRANFTAMTRLDQNRAKAQLSIQSGAPVKDIKKLAIWGNHSPTMYPNYTHAEIGGKALTDVITDGEWLEGEFMKTVQQRGKAIINARGKSSAASAAWAGIDHVKDWFKPTAAGEYVSMAVPSDGSYGVPEGLIFSFPCTVDESGQYHIVQGLEIDEKSKARIEKTAAELSEERETVKDLLN